MELYIVRHGQTVWNVENKVQGRTDIPLNEEGIRQAEKLAEVLKDTPLDLVITSPLSRAWVTGKTVADSHGIPCLTDDRLIEMCFGEFEGTDRRQKAYQREKRRFFARYPQGESFMDVAARVYSFLQDIRETYPDKSILVASHNGICRVMCNYFQDMENEEFADFAMGNCEVRHVSI